MEKKNLGASAFGKLCIWHMTSEYAVIIITGIEGFLLLGSCTHLTIAPYDLKQWFNQRLQIDFYCCKIVPINKLWESS